MVQGPGENAGVLRLPDGWAVAFKIESHNHPSAVEPYQGAATGVGGILRDVFTMGARPVALLNSLRFGPLDQARNRYLFAGVVKGVGDYGNCVGVPTLGGEVDFGPSYGGNPLVNAMCVGLLKERDLIKAAARGVGSVLLVSDGESVPFAASGIASVFRSHGVGLIVVRVGGAADRFAPPAGYRAGAGAIRGWSRERISSATTISTMPPASQAPSIATG